MRANVFSGPRVDLHLTAANKYARSEVQKQAQNALDFLHQLLVAHVWVCCQVCLLVQGKGNLVELATRPVTRDQFDLHFLVGHIGWTVQPRMRLFEDPSVKVQIDNTDYKVAGAACVQVVCAKRCATVKIPGVVLNWISSAVPNTGGQLLHSMLTMHDFWHLQQCCEQHASALHATFANQQVIEAPQIISWALSGQKVLGLLGAGIAKNRSPSTVPVFQVCAYPNPGIATPTAEWKLAMALVAE